MTYIVASDQTVYWAVEYLGEIVITGINELGGKTGVPPSLTAYFDTSENAFLDKVAGKAGEYQPLPSVGEPVFANVIYAYNDGLVICRQDHARTIYPPEETPALFIVYRENQADVLDWIAGEQVEVGMHRLYNGTEYECIQAHVTQSDWTPPVVPALWRAYSVTPAEWVAGTYAIDVLVTHNGRTWKSLMDGNAWEPGVVGTWRDQSDPPLWVAPAGSVGLWQSGDIAEYNGQVWRCTSNNNAFAPGVFGWVLV